MTLYKVTIISGRRWSYLVRAYCAGDAMRWAMRKHPAANWLNTSCQAV